MAYEASYFGRDASVGIGLDACRVVRISLLFRELVDVEELNRRLGVVPRHERRALLGDDLELELQIGSEHDPQGQQQMLIYPSLGIDAYHELSGKGVELVVLREPWPSCDG